MSIMLEVNFSDLINRPKDTVAKLQADSNHQLRLRRRDDEDLVLTTAAQAEQLEEVVDSTTRVLVAFLRHDPEAQALFDVLPDAFPWVRFLPDHDVRAFFQELVDVARAANDLRIVTPIVQVVEEWKNTAAIWADPSLAASLQEDRGEDGGPVPMPQVLEGDE